jgi:hypothetical protein
MLGRAGRDVVSLFSDIVRQGPWDLVRRREAAREFGREVDLHSVRLFTAVLDDGTGGIGAVCTMFSRSTE